MKYDKLKELREDQDLSQREIARYLNIKQNTYSRYETGERGIPLEIIDRLADYYGTSVDFLLGRTDERRSYKRLTDA